MTTEEKTKEEEEIVPTKTAGKILFCGCTDFKNVGRTKQIDESVFANVNVPSKISTFENENDLEFTSSRPVPRRHTTWPSIRKGGYGRGGGTRTGS